MLYPYHTKLVLTTFLKIMPNGLKLCANEEDVVATCYDLFTNFMDGLGTSVIVYALFGQIYLFYPDHSPFNIFLGRARTF